MRLMLSFLGMTARGHLLIRVTLASIACLCVASAAVSESELCEQTKAKLDQMPLEHRRSSLAKACGILDEKSGPSEEDLRRERADSLTQLQRRHFRPVVAKQLGFRASAKPILVNGLHLGDGWGCARLHDESTYCWQASTSIPHAGPIQAEHIPWLDDRWIGVGPDRVCTRELRDRYQCWRAPEFMSLPRTWHAPDVKGLTSEVTWEVTQPQRPDGDASTWDRQKVTHGPWHGCSASWCWNPNEPQSGVKLCRSGNTVVPCSVASGETLREFDKRPSIGDAIVGDLFTCKRWYQGVECLGASRDGFFGTAAECPPELFTSWPTLERPVAAPNAKCARKPVRVGTSRFLGNDASTSPRGVCIGDEGDQASKLTFKCYGAVTPIQQGLTSIVLGLSDEPSACGLNSAGKVICWGHGYTEGTTSKEGKNIEFDIPKSGRAIGWQGSGRFRAGCNIERNCAKAAAKLPACPPTQTSLQPSNVFLQSEQLKDKRISVAGSLGMSDVVSDQVGVECGPYQAGGTMPDVKRGGGSGEDYCCLEAHGPVVVAASSGFLPLEGILCSGDRSRMCCNLPVLGQAVVVTGTLVWRDYVPMLGPSWAIANPEICEVRRPASPPLPIVRPIPK